MSVNALVRCVSALRFLDFQPGISFICCPFWACWIKVIQSLSCCIDWLNNWLAGLLAGCSSFSNQQCCSGVAAALIEETQEFFPPPANGNLSLPLSDSCHYKGHFQVSHMQEPETIVSTELFLDGNVSLGFSPLKTFFRVKMISWVIVNDRCTDGYSAHVELIRVG